MRQGYTAGFAPPGTPAIDIMVYDGRCQVHRNIQVKTHSPDGAWAMGRKHETPVAGLFFCLVSLPETEDGRHNVYVMPSDVVAAVLSLDHRLWLGRPGRDGQAHRDNNVRELLPIDRTFFRTFLEIQGGFALILTVLVAPPPQPTKVTKRSIATAARRMPTFRGAPCAIAIALVAC